MQVFFQRGALLATALVGLLGTTRLAMATTGGPTTIEVLGYAEADRRVYLLVDSEADDIDLPRLSYLDLDHTPPTLVAVESWYEGESEDAVEAAFHERLAALRARLSPLAPLSTAAVDVEVELVRRWKFSPPNDPEWKFKAYDLRATVTWEGRTAQADLVAYYSRKVRLVGGWTVPGTDVALCVLGHTGIWVEGGYELQTLLLLADRGADAAP